MSNKYTAKNHLLGALSALIITAAALLIYFFADRKILWLLVAMIGGGAFAVCLAAFFAHALRQLKAPTLSKIDKMSGHDFESLLADIFRAQGYEVTLTKKSRDYGADLLLHSGKSLTAVQAKRKRGKISLDAVQQAAAAQRHYGADSAMVVTNSTFTKAAQSLAASNNVRLIDRNGLAMLVRAYRKGIE